MNEFYGGRSRVPAAGKVYWQQWVPVARGKGTCGPGIQRALGAAHSIPYPFSSLPRPSNPDLSRTRSPYRLTALPPYAFDFGNNSACYDDVYNYIERCDTLISFLPKPAGLT